MPALERHRLSVAQRIGATFVMAAGALGHASAETTWSYHGAGTVRSGWSDNISAVPEDSPVGLPPHTDAIFVTLEPMIRAVAASPKVIHILGYALEVNRTFGADAIPDSLANRFTWESFYYATPRSDLETSVLFEHGRAGTLLGLGGPTGADLRPVGAFDYLRIDGEQTYTLRLSRAWTARQMSNLGGFAILARRGVAQAGAAAGAGGALEHAWRNTSLGFQVESGYANINRPDDMLHVINWRGFGILRRDFGRKVTTRLEGGVTGVFGTDRMVRGVIRPRWTAEASFREELIWTSLSYRRDTGPNLFIGENVDSDTGTLMLGWALPMFRDPIDRRPTLSLQASASIGRARIIDLRRSGVEVPWNSRAAGVGLSFAPRQDGLQFALIYRYAEQSMGERTTSAGLSTLIPFEQNTVFLAVGGRYPPEPEERSRLPRVRGDRVDNQDADGGALAPVVH